MENKKNANASSSTIGFRLDPEYGDVLATRAKALGISPHELARRYLIEVLEQSDEHAALRLAVQTLSGNVTHFRDDFIFAVEALLASAGKVNEGEATAWVDEHFN